jgi:hypothetical protein
VLKIINAHLVVMSLYVEVVLNRYLLIEPTPVIKEVLLSQAEDKALLLCPELLGNCAIG